LNLLGFVVFELAVFEFDDAIGDVEVMIVVANHEYSFAARSEVRQELIVEALAKNWVLVGGPFVEEVDRAVFQPCGDEGETFALSGGGEAIALSSRPTSAPI
jgi:hypothetical protein